MKSYRYVVSNCVGIIIALVLCTCSKSPSTPMNSIQAVCVAVKNKDVAAYKKMLSKGKLANMEILAKQSDMSVDDLLKKYLDVIICPDALDTGDEKINGATATVKLKNPTTGEVEKYNFVEEDGVWKFDK